MTNQLLIAELHPQVAWWISKLAVVDRFITASRCFVSSIMALELLISQDWFKGTSTGNHGFSPSNWGFLKMFPKNTNNWWLTLKPMVLRNILALAIIFPRMAVSAASPPNQVRRWRHQWNIHNQNKRGSWSKLIFKNKLSLSHHNLSFHHQEQRSKHKL